MAIKFYQLKTLIYFLQLHNHKTIGVAINKVINISNIIFPICFLPLIYEVWTKLLPKSWLQIQPWWYRLTFAYNIFSPPFFTDLVSNIWWNPCRITILFLCLLHKLHLQFYYSHIYDHCQHIDHILECRYDNIYSILENAQGKRRIDLHSNWKIRDKQCDDWQTSQWKRNKYCKNQWFMQDS